MKEYLRKDKSGKLEFVRFDFKGWGVGCHLGHGNYLKGRGWELFTNRYLRCWWIFKPFLEWHIGWTKEYGKSKFIRLIWSGSINEPFSGWSLKIGRFGIGRSHTPKWIQPIAQWKRDQYWNRVFEEQNQFEAEHPELFPPESFYDSIK